MSRPKGATYIGLITITLFFVVVELFVLYLVNLQNNKKLSENLHHSMEVALATVNPERTKNLDSHSTDTQNTEYVRLKQQLVLLIKPLKIHGLDSIYIMKQDEDGIKFLVDSFEENAERYSAPGEKYIEPAAELIEVFKDEQPRIAQPYTDEYGNFISYFSPIKTLDQQQQIVGVMGVDMDYQYITKYNNNERIRWTLVVSALYIIVLLLFFYFSNRFYTQKKIKEAEDFLRNVIDSINDIFIVADQKGQILLWNKSLSKTLGYSDKQIAATKIWDLFPYKERDKFRKFWQNANEQNIKSIEITFKNKQKEDEPFEFDISILQNSKNQITGIASTGRNIRERKLNEIKLFQQKKEAEEMNNFMIGRELKMIELKKKIKELENKK